jgi:dihydrodipicolinate synthase/N-acetylneuraminate lyase
MREMIGPAIPRLWCPPITHYAADGTIDIARTASHWRTIVAHVGGFLVPGSTGDGWEMSESEIAGTLTVATDLAVDLGTRVLIGVLRTDVPSMLAVLESILADLKRAAGTGDTLEAMQRRNVAAFTICPPKGADLSQQAIQSGLETVLNLGLPTALYQLPQVTENEITPDTFRYLAAKYDNLLLFKDTSGDDRVALADRDQGGIFLVRGAEGDYAHWLREAGGCYDGLLLSSANCFAPQFGEMIALLESGEVTAATALSARIAAAVDAAFNAVADLPDGNPFANANKAIDHVLAYGPNAMSVAPPRLHAGSHLPREVIAAVITGLAENGFTPTKGYL